MIQCDMMSIKAHLEDIFEKLTQILWIPILHVANDGHRPRNKDMKSTLPVLCRTKQRKSQPPTIYAHFTQIKDIMSLC